LPVRKDRASLIATTGERREAAAAKQQQFQQEEGVCQGKKEEIKVSNDIQPHPPR
jgi:hypothetical protein